MGRKPKYLGLDNEKDYLGRGLSTCAVCDAFFYKDAFTCSFSPLSNVTPEILPSFSFIEEILTLYLISILGSFFTFSTKKSSPLKPSLIEVHIDNDIKEVVTSKNTYTCQNLILAMGRKPHHWQLLPIDRHLF